MSDIVIVFTQYLLRNGAKVIKIIENIEMNRPDAVTFFLKPGFLFIFDSWFLRRI